VRSERIAHALARNTCRLAVVEALEVKVEAHGVWGSFALEDLQSVTSVQPRP
jgi:hypothetical protein